MKINMKQSTLITRASRSDGPKTAEDPEGPIQTFRNYAIQALKRIVGKVLPKLSIKAF